MNILNNIIQNDFQLNNGNTFSKTNNAPFINSDMIGTGLTFSSNMLIAGTPVVSGSPSQVIYFDELGFLTSDSHFTRDLSANNKTLIQHSDYDVFGATYTTSQTTGATAGPFNSGSYNSAASYTTKELGIVGAKIFTSTGDAQGLLAVGNLNTGSMSYFIVDRGGNKFGWADGASYSIIFTLPKYDGTASDVMVTDGSGNLSFTSSNTFNNYSFSAITSSTCFAQSTDDITLVDMSIGGGATVSLPSGGMIVGQTITIKDFNSGASSSNPLVVNTQPPYNTIDGQFSLTSYTTPGISITYVFVTSSITGYNGWIII